MTIQNRIRRLEQKVGTVRAGTNCSQCWHGRMFQIVEISAADYLAGRLQANPLPCKKCGRLPRIIMLIVVENRDEAQALRKSEAKFRPAMDNSLRKESK